MKYESLSEEEIRKLRDFNNLNEKQIKELKEVVCLYSILSYSAFVNLNKRNNE